MFPPTPEDETSSTIVLVVVLRPRPFSWWHQRKIEGALHPLFSIFVSRIEEQSEHDDDDEDDLG